jgi:hypothetical protein
MAMIVVPNDFVAYSLTRTRDEWKFNTSFIII